MQGGKFGTRPGSRVFDDSAQCTVCSSSADDTSAPQDIQSSLTGKLRLWLLLQRATRCHQRAPFWWPICPTCSAQCKAAGSGPTAARSVNKPILEERNVAQVQPQLRVAVAFAVAGGGLSRNPTGAASARRFTTHHCMAFLPALDSDGVIVKHPNG